MSKFGEKRTVSLATIPERRKSLNKTLRSLRAFADEINVYLNGHKTVPPIVTELRCNYQLSSESGDFGDAGKFFWADKITEGWCFTCDDDFFYEPRYTAHMIEGAERLGGRAAVSLHGVILCNGLRHGEAVNWLQNGRREMFQARHRVYKDRQVHLAGTGVLCYRADLLDISMADFPLPNMADVWFARLCKRQGVDRYVLEHPPDLAKCISPPIPGGAQHRRMHGDYAEHIAKGAPWEKI